jgi:uroporphyrinogen decarboxylase
VTGDKLLLRACRGEKTERVPFWFMRQAGRYLPEYRALRGKAKHFLDACFTPEMAAEITLQPIRRFGMDGAILFSDILVIPYALGVGVEFLEGEGPRVEITNTCARIEKFTITEIRRNLAPVAQAITLIKKQLPAHVTLLGFAGAPWTVACYMLQGKSGKEFAKARGFAHSDPQVMQQLIEALTDATIDYLSMQIEAGVEAVQLFDSWAGLLTPAQFQQWSLLPTQKIIAALKAKYPEIPVIGFPKGAALALKEYLTTGADVIGIDMQTPMEFAIAQAGKIPLQGNLDPLLLAYDSEGALQETDRILAANQHRPFIFNLGHGMIPEMPIAHVERLVEKLKSYQR